MSLNREALNDFKMFPVIFKSSFSEIIMSVNSLVLECAEYHCSPENRIVFMAFLCTGRLVNNTEKCAISLRQLICSYFVFAKVSEFNFADLRIYRYIYFA